MKLMTSRKYVQKPYKKCETDGDDVDGAIFVIWDDQTI